MCQTSFLAWNTATAWLTPEPVPYAERESGERIELDVEQMLITLLSELPLKQAVSLASKLSGMKKNTLYKLDSQVIFVETQLKYVNISYVKNTLAKKEPVF